jgi:NADH:ubiquinone oxidoreductase subunit 2 (subunit N)
MGLPPTGGFIAKWLLVRAALESGQWWWAAVVLAGGLIAAGYVFRTLKGAFVPPAPEPRPARASRGSEILSLILASISLLLGVAPSWPLELLLQADGGGR